MKKYFLIICFFSFISYSQNKVELLINRVASDIVPENFNFYYLVQEGLNDDIILDSLNFKSIILLKIRLTEIPSELLVKQKFYSANLKSYQIDKAKFISQEIENQKISNKPDIYFVDENITNDSLNNLKKRTTINTLIVKKSNKWLKVRLRKEIEKVWSEDKEIEKEKNVCYGFSIPVFSKDGLYARISVSESRACKIERATYIYRLEDEDWKLVTEFQQYSTILMTTHTECESFHSYNVIDKLCKNIEVGI